MSKTYIDGLRDALAAAKSVNGYVGKSTSLKTTNYDFGPNTTMIIQNKIKELIKLAEKENS